MSLLHSVLSEIDHDEERPKVYGVMPGTVTKVDEDAARVKLTFAWLHEDEESEWARIAVTMAGDGTGHYYLPEPGDEALCAFEHGDVRFPYVVGFLWGKDKPPRQDRQKRIIRSRSGHEVVLDDTEGSGSVTVKTAGGQEVRLQDGPGTPELRIDATGGGVIEMNCREARIRAPLGVTVEAAGGVTVNAPRTTFNGIVEAQLVQTQVLQSGLVSTGSVVSSTYTSGIGNFV